MHLKFEWFDGRRRCSRPIIIEETGERIGTIRSHGVGFSGYDEREYGGIEISLFNDTYRIRVHRYDECWGYIKGVEAVLNRVMPLEMKANANAAA